MNKGSLITLIIALYAILVFSKKLTQIERGTIMDTDNKLPLYKLLYS